MQLLKSIKKNFINPILQEIAINLVKAIIKTKTKKNLTHI